ncbi:MAG: hypothetical protein E7037_00910 [Verrucomicrobia bacterium]|nr:hypothetical protein [Verrucomicrobiota bacterium]
MKSSFWKILLWGSFFVAPWAFGISSSEDHSERERKVRMIEEIIFCLESGDSLTQEQETALFSDPLIREWEYFWALNYKDRRVQRVKELVEKSKYSKSRKEMFGAIVSREARSHCFSAICREGSEFPAMLSRENWAPSFVKKPIPVEKQKVMLSQLADVYREYLFSLESEGGTNFENVRKYFDKATRTYISVLKLPSPAKKEEADTLAEWFLKNNLPLIARAMRFESEYFHSGADIYELCGIDIGDVLFADSYLIDYVLLRHRKEILDRQNSIKETM